MDTCVNECAEVKKDFKEFIEIGIREVDNGFTLDVYSTNSDGSSERKRFVARDRIELSSLVIEVIDELDLDIEEEE